MLRLPYGEDTDACDEFDFEEVGRSPGHEEYLWGNPAIACALLLAEGFTDGGWEMRLSSHLEVGGLPLHVYRLGGEVVAKPCAEMWMTDRAASRLLQRGLMPLASIKDRDVVRLVRFQSVAEPATALPGRWAHA